MKGKEIRENRLRIGLTQQQLADKLKVHVRSVRNWEAETTTHFHKYEYSLKVVFGLHKLKDADLSEFVIDELFN